MDFQDSPLKQEADRIVYSEGTGGAYKWSLELKLQDNAPVDLTNPDLAVTEREREGFFKPMKLTNLDFVRDYEKAAGEHVNCALVMTSGMWLKVIFPARKHLTAHITRQKLDRADGSWDEDEEIKTFVYKALIKMNEAQGSETSTAVNISRQELDIRGFVTLDLDLVDPALEQMRGLSVGGTWRKATGQQVIEALYATECEAILVDGEAAVDGMEFAKGASTTVREHILLEQGTPFLNVPHLIHEHAGGLWPTGMNCFFQERLWYTYPTFDTTRFDEETQTLTIIRVPGKLYSSPESTFELDGTRLKIVATSTSQMFDNTHARYLTEGDGVRFADADSVMTGWATTKDNKLNTKRGDTNFEVRIKDASTPDHFTKMSRSRITANAMVEYSNLAARRGQVVSFLWENGDFTLLRPGMMCKILYLRGDDVAELQGVLLNVHAGVQMFGEGLASDSFRTTCALFIFCNIEEES